MICFGYNIKSSLVIRRILSAGRGVILAQRKGMDDNLPCIVPLIRVEGKICLVERS